MMGTYHPLDAFLIKQVELHTVIPVGRRKKPMKLHPFGPNEIKHRLHKKLSQAFQGCQLFALKSPSYLRVQEVQKSPDMTLEKVP